MADQGIVPVAPAAVPVAPPPPPTAPAEASDVGSVKDWGEEADLIKQAFAEVEGGEQPVDPEAPKVEVAPEKPKEEQTQAKLSKGFAKLAAEEDRFERRKVDENSKLQNVIADIEKREAAVKPLQEAMAKAANSPLEALQMLGYSYKDLVDYVMADGKIPPEKFAERLSQQQKSDIDQVRAELDALKQQRQEQQQAWEAQQETTKREHEVKTLFADGSTGLAKYPVFADRWSESPDNARMLMNDVNNVLTQHFNQTCVRDEKGRIVRPGEKLDAERAVIYIEGILASMQMRPRNPGQPGAVPQTANAGAARQQAPKPLTPRDLSVTSMPSDDELSKMSQEELDALALRMYNGE